MRVHRRLPHLLRPQTFSEVIARTLVVTRNPLIPLTTDKHAVRAYVAAKVGTEVLATQFQVARSFGELTLEALPEAVVLKATHGSGMTCLITGGQGASRRDLEVFDERSVLFDLPRSSVDARLLAAPIERWLATDFSTVNNEWNYRGLKRQVVAEEYLGAVSDGVFEFSFYCIKGRVLSVTLCLPGATKLFVDRAYRRLEIRDWTRRPPPSPLLPKPAAFDRMVTMAEALAADFESVRVDWFLRGDRVVFGELTHATRAGFVHYDPLEFTEVFAAFFRGETTIPERFYAEPRCG